MDKEERRKISIRNLKDRRWTSEEAREAQRLSVKKRKENQAERKFLSQLYADFLAEEFKVSGREKMSGAEYCKKVIATVLSRSDSSSVSMLKEMREATEGQKLEVTGDVNASMMTTEEMKAEFQKLMGR